MNIHYTYRFKVPRAPKYAVDAHFDPAWNLAHTALSVATKGFYM